MSNPCIKICDRIFLSVPLGIVLMLSVCALCLAGTSAPFNHIFRSTWFLLYLSYLGFVMLYCSVRRLPSLFGLCSVRREAPSRSDDVKGIFCFNTLKENKLKISGLLSGILAKRGYRKVVISGEDTSGTVFLFEKAKIGIFGPQLVHLGIAVLFMAGIITSWGGRFYDLNIREGESVKLEGTETSLTLEKFSVVPGPEKGKADEYFSRLRINRPASPVEWRTLKVNAPVRLDGFRLYQMRYSFDLKKLDIAVFTQKEDRFLKTISVDMNKRVILEELDIGIEVKDFVPDFVIDAGKNVSSRSHSLKNPACYVRVYSPAASQEVVQQGWIFRGISASHNNDSRFSGWKMRIDNVRVRNISGIKFTKNPAEYITYFGLVLLVAGAFLSCYKFYRCLIVQFSGVSGGDNLNVHCSARRAKNMFEFEREMKMVKEEFFKNIGNIS